MIKQTWVALLLVLATCTWAHTQSRSDSIRMLSSYPQAPTPLDTFVVGWQVVHNFPKLSDSTRLTATAQSNYRSYYLSIDSLNNIYPIKDILNKPLTSDSRFTPKE